MLCDLIENKTQVESLSEFIALLVVSPQQELTRQGICLHFWLFVLPNAQSNVFRRIVTITDKVKSRFEGRLTIKNTY